MKSTTRIGALVTVWVFLLTGHIACSAGSTPPAAANAAETSGPGRLDIEDYAKALKYVDDHGMVNYKGLKANRAPLDAYLKGAADLDPKVYDGWTDAEKIAFYSNVYNALTLRSIIDNYPIKASTLKSLVYPKNSIRQISSVWDSTHTVMGEKVSLNNIEHDILRKDFDEPRLHAALVCAAMGCPPLRSEAFHAEKLDSQLDDQMKRLNSHPERFKIDREANVVWLSSIFDWYGTDFEGKFGSTDKFQGQGETERAVLNAVSRHLSDADRNYLETGAYKVKHLDYDWSLNEQAEKGHE